MTVVLIKTITLIIKATILLIIITLILIFTNNQSSRLTFPAFKTDKEMIKITEEFIEI